MANATLLSLTLLAVSVSTTSSALAGSVILKFSGTVNPGSTFDAPIAIPAGTPFAGEFRYDFDGSEVGTPGVHTYSFTKSRAGEGLSLSVAGETVETKFGEPYVLEIANGESIISGTQDRLSGFVEFTDSQASFVALGGGARIQLSLTDSSGTLFSSTSIPFRSFDLSDFSGLTVSVDAFPLGAAGFQSFTGTITSLESVVIPEPSSLCLLGCGAIGMAVTARRRRKRQPLA